ncbi:MAG: hypothetical protein JWM98_304 [Thermoleophilia bacterium]|nr:hypothetical protein [Thermoleophilia bacterium]
MPSGKQLVDFGLEHVARFAYRRRDNPFLSIGAVMDLGSNHRTSLTAILDGQLDPEDWLRSPEASRLLTPLRVLSVPRVVGSASSGGQHVITAPSVHAFAQAPLFWWVVSAIWCMTAGRDLDECISERIVGYRLHSLFRDNPGGAGYMFRNPQASYAAWKRRPAWDADIQTACTAEIDGSSFYYRVRAVPSDLIELFDSHRGNTTSISLQGQRATRLLDAFHIAYSERLHEVNPRGVEGTVANVPLPVGPPSSLILANLIMDVVSHDLSARDGVLDAWVYADDVLLSLRDLPEPQEHAEDLLARLQILDEHDLGRTLLSNTASDMADYRVGIEKISIRQPPTATDTPDPDSSVMASESRALDNDDDEDPYIDDWEAELGTAIRVGNRQLNQKPKELGLLRELVRDIRIGIPPGKAQVPLRKIMAMDDTTFVAIRTYWTELIACGLYAHGTSFAADLRTRLIRIIDHIWTPQPSALKSLASGLEASFIQSASQALAVLYPQDEVAPAAINFGFSEPAANRLTVFATKLRKRGIFPAELVSPILAEYTEWEGTLMGQPAQQQFADWASKTTGIGRQLQHGIAKSPRFVPLHEICLGVHLWMDDDDPTHPLPLIRPALMNTDTWLRNAFSLFASQALVNLADVPELLNHAVSIVHPSTQTQLSSYDQNHSLRLGLPNITVSEELLRWRIDDDPKLAEEETRLRDSIDIIWRYAVEAKADLLLLPEWSTPLVHIGPLFSRANQRGIAVILGETPFIEPGTGTYFNRMWTSLPIKDPADRRHSLVLPPRTKGLLSPHEIQVLEQHGTPYREELADTPVYHWREVRFASVICYEFADVAIRNSLRGRIDMMTVSSFNHDWRYFDSIQDSCTRDIYCVTACVNVSQFPGTRVTRPTRSSRAVAATIHGSTAPALATAAIDFGPVVGARRTGLAPKASFIGVPEDGLCSTDYKPLPPGYKPK